MDGTRTPPETRGADRLLVRVGEAGEMLGIKRSKVYELLAAGEIESVTIGRSRRIPVDALRDYVAGLREGGVD